MWQRVIEGGCEVHQYHRRCEHAGSDDSRWIAALNCGIHEDRYGSRCDEEPHTVADSVRDLFTEGLRVLAQLARFDHACRSGEDRRGRISASSIVSSVSG